MRVIVIVGEADGDGANEDIDVDTASDSDNDDNVTASQQSVTTADKTNISNGHEQMDQWRQSPTISDSGPVNLVAVFFFNFGGKKFTLSDLH